MSPKIGNEGILLLQIFQFTHCLGSILWIKLQYNSAMQFGVFRMAAIRMLKISTIYAGNSLIGASSGSWYQQGINYMFCYILGNVKIHQFSFLKSTASFSPNRCVSKSRDSKRCQRRSRSASRSSGRQSANGLSWFCRSKCARTSFTDLLTNRLMFKTTRFCSLWIG